MEDSDWGTLEQAWTSRYQHPPRTTSLPQLLANADKAVASAIDALTQDYEAVVGSGTAACEHAVQHCASFPSPTAGGELTTSYVDRSDVEASGVDWRQLYSSLCLIQAPMVRCSRPAFRQVCRLWGTTVSYTHMLIAESFVKSPHARHAEFATYANEDRLVVQLAAKDGPAAAQAAVLVRPYCDAVDLNCGCPQRWAIKEGIGAALLEKPELVADMVRAIRNATPEGNGDTPALPCVVKMRVKDDLRHSVDFARQCEAAGAAWLTVHGRTPHCHPSAAVQFDAVRHVRESVAIPVVLNGGVSDVSSALHGALRTGCGGVMSANGLLDNPAMFYCGGDAVDTSKRPTLTFSTAGGIDFGEEEEQDKEGKVVAASPFAPVRPVSFLWAPPRSASEDSGRSGDGASAAPPTMLRYTLPSMSETVVTPREVISDFVRCAIRTDLAVPTTVQQVLRMARVYVSPAERNHLALLRSNLSVLSCLQELGVYVEEGCIRV